MRRRFRPSIGRSTLENKGDTNNATTTSDTATASPPAPVTRRARIKPKVGIVGNSRTGCPVQRRPQTKPSHEIKLSEPVEVPLVKEKYVGCLESSSTALQDSIVTSTIVVQSTGNQAPDKNRNLQDEQHNSTTDLENIRSNQGPQEKGRSEEESCTVGATGLQNLQDVTPQNLQEPPLRVSTTDLQNIRNNETLQKIVSAQDEQCVCTTELQNNNSQKNLNLQDESQITLSESSNISTETIPQRNLDSQGDHPTRRTSVAASPGLTSVAASTGLTSVAASAGPTSVAASAGLTSVAAATRPSSIAASAGPTSVAASAGPTLVAAATRLTSVAASAGPTSVAAATGPTSVAASAGLTSVAASAGPMSVAAAAGPTSVAASAGPTSVAAATGPTSVAASAGQTSVAASAGLTSVAASAGLTSVAASAGYVLHVDNVVHPSEGNNNAKVVPESDITQVERSLPVLIPIDEDSLLLQSRTEPESNKKSTSNVIEENTQESTRGVIEIVAESHLPNLNLDFSQLHNADELLKNLLGSDGTVSNLNNTGIIEVITDLQPSGSECTVLPAVVNREEGITSYRSGPTTTKLNIKRRRARPRVRLPRPQAGCRQPDFNPRQKLDSSEIPIASNVEIDIETSNPETQVIDHPVLELPIDLIQDAITQDCAKEKKTMRSLKQRFRQRNSGTVKVVVSRQSLGNSKDDSSTRGTECEGTTTSEEIEDDRRKRQEIAKKRKVGPNVMQSRRKRSGRNQQEQILVESDVSDSNVEKVSECGSAENQENIIEVLASSEEHAVGRQERPCISILANNLEVQNEDSANAITEILEVENRDSINVNPTLSDSHDIENQDCIILSTVPVSSTNLDVTHEDNVTTVFTSSNNLEDISLSIPDNTMDDILQDISEPLSAVAECRECPEILTSISTSVSDNAQAPEQNSSNDLVPGTLENFMVMVSTQSTQGTTSSTAPVSTIAAIGDNSTESTMTMWQQKGKKPAARRKKVRGKVVDEDLGAEVMQSVDKEVGSQDVGDPKGAEGTQGDNEEPVSQDPKGSKGIQKGKKVRKRKRKVRGKVVDDDEGQEGTQSLNKGSESQGTVEPDGSSGTQGVDEGPTSEGHQGIPGDQITHEVTGGKKRRGRAVKPKVPAKRGRKKTASKEPAQVSEENGDATASTSVGDGGETSGLPAENEENSTSQKTKKKRRTPIPKTPQDSSKQRDVSASEGESTAKKSKRQENADQSNSVVNISSMRISDMVHYNPKTNPMKSSNTDDTPEGVLSGLSPKDNESEIILPAVDQDETSVDGGPQQPSSVLAPRVTIDADGNIVLDEESLVIQSTGATEDVENRELVFENANQQYKSSLKKLRMDKWNKEETLYFYEILSQIGTDFSLMSKLFTKRSRTELKKKFKREEKVNRDLIEKALSQRNPIPASLFAEFFEETEEEMERALVVSPEQTPAQE